MSETFAAECITALKNGAPYPYAKSYGVTDLAGAYACQAAFVESRLSDEDQNGIAGYKAALTAPPAQTAMGIHEPIVGVLLKSGAKAPGEVLTPPTGTLLETELGFTLKTAVTAPLDAAEVMELVDYVQPCIEIANPNMKSPSAIDLVATNSAAYQFIPGNKLSGDTNLDDLSAALHLEEDAVFAGRCGDVMSGQAAALAWLINQVLALGYRLVPGHFLMTGSVGGVAPAAKGHYRGSFGPEVIEFQIS